jgi:DNA-directed RNA polymerase specialized sigma24 family protein
VVHRSPPSRESSDDPDRSYGVDQVEEVPDEALARTEVDLSSIEGDVSEEERFRRSAADRKILEILARENFEGERFVKLYNKLASRLTGYAYPILMKWLSTGQVFRECERYRRPVNKLAAASRWTTDERHEIVAETIIEAVDFFRDYGLRQGKWDWRRGASLKVYFVGSCVCSFPRIYQKWWKQKSVTQSVLLATRDCQELQPDDLLDIIADPQPDPCAIAVVRDEAYRAMEKITDPQLRQMVWLRATGYTQAEAAQEVGLTDKAAERRLHYHRKKYGMTRLPALPAQMTGEQDRS